jgi:hypothetical protein
MKEEYTKYTFEEIEGTLESVLSPLTEKLISEGVITKKLTTKADIEKAKAEQEARYEEAKRLAEIRSKLRAEEERRIAEANKGKIKK